MFLCVANNICIANSSGFVKDEWLSNRLADGEFSQEIRRFTCASGF